MSWKPLSAPFTLEQGAQYACAIKLSFAAKLVATADMVAQKFTDAGFSNVVVDMNAGPRAEGVWAQPDQDDVSLPSEVTTVWQWVPDAAG